MSEEQNQNNKTNENDKDVTSNSDIKNEQISLAQKAPTSSSSPSSHFSAHLVTTINRDAIATPHIDNIIEEEEEEEEKETCLDENVNNKTNLNESAPNHQKQTHTEFSKFTLEPVHLDIESPQPAKPSITDTPTKFNIEKIDTSDSSTPILIETNKSTPSTSAKHSLANLQGNVSPIAPHNKAPKSKPEDVENVEVVEIRVEEGYATRQMDEYFRQTIAAIKEELTKKLENKNEKNGGNKHRNAESGVNTDSDDNEFDDYDNETFDNDEANEYSYDHDRHSNECNECMGCCDNFHDKNNNSNHANSSHSQHHRHICNRRNLLYHHLMISSSKKRSKTDKANAWLALLGCFLNQFIIEGLCYNYANLFDIVQKEFKTTSKLVSSMPATFLLGFYLLLAPISLFLAKKFGTRRIALIGSFISTVSLLISSLLNDSIIVFSIFYGILNGIGLSLIYVPSVIATSKWFLKKRLFANSVTILGACLGAAIYPLTSEFLLRKYELFDSLLILAGVQLNCVVGSMLLREHKSTLGLSRKKKKSQHGGVDDKNYKKAKTKSTSSAHLLENEHTEHKPANGELNKKQPAQTNGDLDKLALVANKRRSLLNDSETESTTASTNTVTNYTLKQYWRKFVQTRKTQANTKKNLFHLIAEEKRKTRTLSKTSLEDGFVITTSNNLLAPNDESHVIVSRHHAAKIQTAQHSSSQSSSRAASKFFTRIANSLRSLAHVGSNSAASTSSPAATTHHSKNHLAAPANLHEINETSKNSSKQPALIPLMSVFSGPINTDTSSAAHDEPENNNNHIPTNLVNVFNNDTNPSITLTTTNELNQTSTTTQVELKNEADGCDSDSDEYDEDEGSPNINTFRNKINSGVASNQISRYLSYRNSLANSVRGSLMECSVPEDRENEDELHSGVDGSSHDEDEILNNSSAAETSIRNKQMNNSGKRRRVKSQLGNRGHLGPNGTSPYTNLRNHNNRINNTLNSGVNGAPGHNENDSGYAMPTLTNIRRFLSIMDSSSFYNAPMNLESVEFNLRNSLIKKCSDSYRKNHKYSKKGHDHDRLSLFLSYLSYLTSFKLFKNALLVVLNLSFFFNIIGKFNSYIVCSGGI